MTRSFDVIFDLSLNKRLSKQPWGWWFETPAWSLWRHRNDGNYVCVDGLSVRWIRRSSVVSPQKERVIHSFYGFFDGSLNKMLKKESSFQWSETPWSSYYCKGPNRQGLALLTLSWDKIMVNWPWFSNVASDWLTALLAANQKLHLKIVVSYPCFYPRIALVAPTPACQTFVNITDTIIRKRRTYFVGYVYRKIDRKRALGDWHLEQTLSNIHNSYTQWWRCLKVKLNVPANLTF